MEKKIHNTANCELRSVIHFLNEKTMRPSEIYCEMKSVYGEVMDESTVRR